MEKVTHEPGRWLDTKTGKEIKNSSLMERLSKQQVVLLGETHNRFDNHRWQLYVAAGIKAHRDDIALGFEMFPRRVQPILDEWVKGGIKEGDFLKEVDWKTVWGHDANLYLPLFHFCREYRLPMYALNCNRPLVTEVGKLGWEKIPIDERDGLTPSKPATPEYRQYLFDVMHQVGRGSAVGAASPNAPSFDRFVRAQQTWDRAFACNITKTQETESPPLIIGIIGRGHLEYGHGTPFQLKDLGIDNVTVLLPSDEKSLNISLSTDIAEAVFRLENIQ